MLTEKQKKMVAEALGDISYWPQMTIDPQVNCAVDVVICGTKPWEQLTNAVKEHYVKEAKAFEAF